MSRSPVLQTSTAEQVRDACLCLHTQRAARRIARFFDDALRPAGLTNEQFSLLMALNRPEPASMREIASVIGADRTTLTAAFKPLVREGLASIQVDPLDARVRRVSLTTTGRARLGEAFRYWEQAHATLEERLGEATPDRLRQDLKTLDTVCAG